MAAIFDIQQHRHRTVPSSQSVLHDPGNMGVAVGISLLSCILHPSPAWCPTGFRLGSSFIHPVHCWRSVDCCSAWCGSSFIRWCYTALHRLLINWRIKISSTASTLHRRSRQLDSSNRLRLNVEKTQILAKINKIPLRVGGVDVFPLDSVRDLGVILDSKLTMKNHVDSVVRSCFYHMHQYYWHFYRVALWCSG